MVDLFETYKGQLNIQRFIFNYAKEVAAIPREKLADYIEIFQKIDESPSQEVQRLKESLLQELLNTADPIGSYRKVEEVFIKNNLPIVGKVFKIFQVLHPPEAIAQKLRNGSPLLTQAKTRGRYYTIYQDLLKIHVESANRSLRQYIEVLLSGEEILQKLDQGGIDNLDEQEQVKLKYFLDKVNTLFINSALAKNITGEVIKTDSPLQERYQQLRTSLGVQQGQALTERIGEMFLKPIGLERLSDVVKRMRQRKLQAHERNLALVANNQLQLKAGDLLKGVQTTYISNILQNGSVAKEFLGAGSTSDSTPFDTDVSLVLPDDEAKGFEGAVASSMAPGFGQLLFALKNRGQFQHTIRGERVVRDPDKLELFATGGGRHYGIRTGFPSTEIDFMVAQDSLINDKRELEKIFYEIAQNGYYIPITDKKGAPLFTPEMYEEYHRTFDGLERFDGAPFTFRPLPDEAFSYNQVKEIVTEKESDEEKISALAETIRAGVKRVLERAGVTLKGEFDSSILGAEFFDIGSTGRRTNLPGDYDFDFTLKLNAKDFRRASEIAQQIKQEFIIQKDESHAEQSGYYQLRAIGVSEISGQQLEKPIDIDIGIVSKSELSVFGSHDAILEKFGWIEKNISQEAKEQVVANIILCKRLLKEGHAYKRVEDGGFGGIGVENWILANGGNIDQAFGTFHDAAYENGERITFEKFQGKYKILNAGMNVKRLFHDNYIENLKPEGYQKMLDVIDKFLAQSQ